MQLYATIDSDSDSPSLHSFMPAVSMLLPASSWYRCKFRPPRIPDHIPELAADCGGFVAAMRWKRYRYSMSEYVRWLCSFPPRLRWAACMDYCCEPPVAGSAALIELRQRKTTARAWQAWTHWRDMSWVWVPTVQGWDVEDYQRHARELAPLIGEMRDRYGPDRGWRVGIGTLCARADAALIRQVVEAVTAELPGVPLHLWGVKLDVLKNRIALPESVISVDTAAWNGLFGQDREEWRISGQRQRQWSYGVALPRYMERFQNAVAQPKQVQMIV